MVRKGAAERIIAITVAFHLRLGSRRSSQSIAMPIGAAKQTTSRGRVIAAQARKNPTTAAQGARRSRRQCSHAQTASSPSNKIGAVEIYRIEARRSALLAIIM